MASQQPQQSVLNTMRILWGALSFSLVLFVGILLFLKASGAAPSGGSGGAEMPPPIFLPVFGAIAATLVAGILVVLPRMHMQALKRAKLEVREDVIGDHAGMYRNTAPKERIFAKPKRAWKVALQQGQTHFILKMALGEAVALFGFTLGQLGLAVTTVLPFFVVAFLLAGWHFPTEAKVLDPLERAYDAKLVRD